MSAMTDEQLAKAVEAQGYERVTVEHGDHPFVEGFKGDWRRLTLRGDAPNELLLKYWNGR